MANALYYGDNLDVLRHEIAAESVDLIYLDPPFNSQANYNVLFKSPAGKAADAQIEAFEDTWHWAEEADAKSEGYTWNPQFTAHNTVYLETFFDQRDKDGRRWKRADLTGAGVRHGETGKSWRGINVTAKGRHWQYPPVILDEFDAAGRIHWPRRQGGMPRLKAISRGPEGCFYTGYDFRRSSDAQFG